MTVFRWSSSHYTHTKPSHCPVRTAHLFAITARNYWQQFKQKPLIPHLTEENTMLKNSTEQAKEREKNNSKMCASSQKQQQRKKSWRIFYYRFLTNHHRHLKFSYALIQHLNIKTHLNANTFSFPYAYRSADYLYACLCFSSFYRNISQSRYTNTVWRINSGWFSCLPILFWILIAELQVKHTVRPHRIKMRFDKNDKMKQNNEKEKVLSWTNECFCVEKFNVLAKSRCCFRPKE